MSEGWHNWIAGTRVVVRRRLPTDTPSGHLFTDVIGHVVSVDAGGVTLRTRPPAERVVTVPADEIVLGKVVPETPRRARGR
jgi:hypothetical protein